MTRRRGRRNGSTIQSNCGFVKMRGNIKQIIEKYVNLAADAEDKIEKEIYLQHAEHYTRVFNKQKNEMVAA